MRPPRPGLAYLAEAFVCIALLATAVWLMTDMWTMLPVIMIIFVMLWVLLS
jgi:hypothetical protein